MRRGKEGAERRKERWWDELQWTVRFTYVLQRLLEAREYAKEDIWELGRIKELGESLVDLLAEIVMEGCKREDCVVKTALWGTTEVAFKRRVGGECDLGGLGHVRITLSKDIQVIVETAEHQ